MHVRGVTYGTFRPDEETSDFPSVESVAEDFAGMAANGVNAVRTYTVPPRWLLDLASEHRLYVMVGLPWEEHVTFLDDRRRTAAIEERMRDMVRSCAGHPAILCYAIGNEIPASIVRWHGKRKIERFLKRLYIAAKSEDPGALVTYVNYPSTEYLSLPFIDLVCFNVFLESGPQFASYLARLQHIAGDRPLVVTEAGLDSLRNSEEAQARALDWQVRTAFSGGCAGMFVFSWTDEWYRGGSEIDDWAFGLVDRNRTPKQALATVGKAYAQVPFAPDPDWPRVSVVVCAYNSESTLRSCFDGLRDLEYPDYEVIVVNDGSTDATDEITGEYDFRLISTENRGLSSARNAGLRGRHGRDRGLHGRGRNSRPALAVPPRDRVHEELACRHRWAQHPAARRRRDRGMRRQRARRADPRAALRRDRRAHPGLQHGLLEGESRCDRRVRPAVPDRGRRRRHLLAAPGPGLDGGLQSRSRCVAPPSRLCERLSEAAVRVRQGRSAAGAQVAGALQPHGAPGVGRPRLRRADREGARRPLEDLLRHLGHGPVPIGLPARARHRRVAAA